MTRKRSRQHHKGWWQGTTAARHPERLWLAVALGALALCVVCSAPSAAQAPVVQRVPIRPISSIDGKALYKAYCIQCHGANGTGDGPAAKALRTPPADLTQLAARNGGQFNRTGVESFIMGDRPGGELRRDPRTGAPVIMKADGPDEMPAWGTLFRYMWPDQPYRLRCGNLARYLESIQAR